MIISGSFPDVESDSAEMLKKTLNKFASVRHHETNADGKAAAWQLITQRFKDAGLDVWTEQVVTSGVCISRRNTQIYGRIYCLQVKLLAWSDLIGMCSNGEEIAAYCTYEQGQIMF